MKPRVLVTGATGFLGGWMVEWLHLRGATQPIAGVRRSNAAARLARFPVEAVHCDVLQPRSLDAAMDDVDYVVHCAIGDDDVAIDGTRNVLEAAIRCGVKQVVHISSIAVYGKAEGSMDETRPLQDRGNAYAARKIAAERVCEEYFERLPITILRPTIIYGPFSAQWTVNFAQRARAGVLGDMGTIGKGSCNLVYAADVCLAAEKALGNPKAAGEAFNVNGSDALNWNEYFTGVVESLELGPVPRINPLTLKLRAAAVQPVRKAGKFALGRYRQFVMKLYKSSDAMNGAMKATESSMRLVPTPEQIRLYQTRAEYPIEKARRVLGFEPQVDAKRGLELSAAWLKHHGIV